MGGACLARSSPPLHNALRIQIVYGLMASVLL
jgi:hypothetical protein